MKIAIVAPSPIPFGVGGAEKLWWGMLEFINKHTIHQCELIKLPTKENSFWDLIDSYYKFYKLDLSYFDMIITGKYPAWMIQHKNHHIYMLHCLRGFYDCSHFLNLNDKIKTDDKRILNILNKFENNSTSIDEIFELLFQLKKEDDLEKELFEFPGLFIKKIIHFFDKQAMKNIKRFSAISKTVANRKEYFPKNTSVNVVYPPSVLTDFKNNSYKYFFTASRLDSAKRIEMIVDAYKESKRSIPLKIAGSGPLLEQLKISTKDDSRIELLGFISDDELIEYYSNAYAVIFIPFDEDYGLITIEAAMSQKAVLTFSDSGGVTEFIEDKISGLVSQPNIKELTKNINYISSNKDLAIKMGKNAHQKVKNITWKNTITPLLNPQLPKLTVVTTYGIYPPRGGGQNRIFYLYKEIAKTFIVDIICLVSQNEPYKKTQIAKDLYEIRVPKSISHAKGEHAMQEKTAIPITDIAMLTLYNLTPKYIKEVKNSCSTSKVVITSHPYTYPLLKEHIKDIPIIYESHNVEYNLKKQMLQTTPYNQKLLEKLFEVEKEASLESSFTTVCANDDAITMKDIYGFDISKAVIVPNGVDLDTVPYITLEKREELKQKLNLQDEKIVLFIGSLHKPNIDAVQEIFKMAKKLPNYKFIVMGSVDKYFKQNDMTIPTNIGFTGISSDTQKELYLSIADIAINPMLSGSGTNLKMLDYMANGIPVISTKVGARGLDIPKDYIAICDIKEFDKYIKDIKKYTDIKKSRTFVEEKFSWDVIEKCYRASLKRII